MRQRSGHPVEIIPPSPSSKKARQAGFRRGRRRLGEQPYTHGPVKVYLKNGQPIYPITAPKDDTDVPW